MHFQVENNNQNQIIQGLSPGQDQEQDISFPVHHKVPALAQIGAFLSEKKKINQAFAQSGKANRKYEITFSPEDRKSTRLNSSHVAISYAVFCLKKKRK